MPGEDVVHTACHERRAQRVGILDHIARQQRLLAVEVLHRVVVHHGHHLLALGVRLTSAVGNPLQRRCRHAAAVMVHVGRVASRGKPVVAVEVRVDADHHQSIDWLGDITQRRGVAQGAAVAIVGINRGKLVAGDGGSRPNACVVEKHSIGVADVVVSRNHQHFDARLLKMRQMPGHALMAGALAVLGEVAGEQHQLRMPCDDVLHPCAHDVVAESNHAHIASHIVVDSRSAGDYQFGRHQVGVARHHYFDFRSRFCHCLRSGKNYQKSE